MWWIIAAALLHIFNSISVSLAIIQMQNLVISQQCQEVSNLIIDLCINFGVLIIADNLPVGVDVVIAMSTNDW